MSNILINKDNQLTYKKKIYTCYIGKNGLSQNKKEGDLKTPKNNLRLLKIFYRKDRLLLNLKNIDYKEIKSDMGWCDDITSKYYNQAIKIPNNKRHEKMKREDICYDILITTDHNKECIINKGSCIFFHIKGEKDYTEGCIALKKADMIDLLNEIDKDMGKSKVLPQIVFNF